MHNMNKEFEVHMLSDEGQVKARAIATIFDSCLTELIQYCPDSRYLSIVRTKLEEACFFAKKAMAEHSTNHY